MVRIIAQALLVAVLLVGGPARGQGGRPTVTLHLTHQGSTASNERIVAALQRELATRREVRFTPLAELLAPAVVRTRRGRLAAAGRWLEAGELRIKNLELDEALTLLRRAVREYEQQFDLLAAAGRGGIARYTRAVGSLGLALFLGGQIEECKQALVQALVVDPAVDYDPTRFPAQMKRTFDEARFLLEALGRGKAEVRSTPPGALVLVNGRPAGNTPLELDLVAARNLVTLSLLGHDTITVGLAVRGGEHVARLKLPLRAVPGAPLSALRRATQEARQGRPGDGMARSCGALHQQVMLVGETAAEDDAFSLQIVAYVAQRRRIVAQVRVSLSEEALGGAMRSAVDALLAGIERPAPRQASRPQRPSWLTRATRWKYFWPTVGAVLGAAAIATTVGVVANAAPEAGLSPGRRVVLLPALGRWP